MKIAQPGPSIVARVPLAKTAPAASPDVVTGAKAGDMVEIVGGGSGAILGSIAGVYSGALGGATVGAILGLGFGPAWGAVTSMGATHFLANSLFGLGLTTRAGIILGGLTGLAGGATLGWRASSKVGQLLGTTPREPSAKPASKIFNGPLATVLVTGGLLSGVGGGFIGGAALAAAHNLLVGGAWSAGTVVSGLVGAALLGTTNMMGASQILKGIQWSGEQAKAGVEKLKPVLDKVNASPYRRVAYGAAAGVVAMGALGCSTGMGVGVAIASAVMGGGLGAVGGLVTQPPVKIRRRWSFHLKSDAHSPEERPENRCDQCENCDDGYGGGLETQA